MYVHIAAVLSQHCNVVSIALCSTVQVSLWLTWCGDLCPNFKRTLVCRLYEYYYFNTFHVIMWSYFRLCPIFLTLVRDTSVITLNNYQTQTNNLSQSQLQDHALYIIQTQTIKTRTSFTLGNLTKFSLDLTSPIRLQAVVGIEPKLSQSYSPWVGVCTVTERSADELTLSADTVLSSFCPSNQFIALLSYLHL